MSDNLATLCIPGLACSPRLYAEQMPHLWTLGPVMVGQHSSHESMADIARSILASAPDRFALIGLSMGGYVSFEILRQAPERVVKLALLDTSARPDSPEQTANRRAQIKQTDHAPVSNIIDAVYPRLVDKSRHGDVRLRQLIRQMADEVGAAGFVRQQTAIMSRPDSRPTLATIRCPTLVLVGEGDELIPPPVSEEIARGIAGATLVKVPDCGHCSTVEQPERVTRALMDLCGVSVVAVKNKPYVGSDRVRIIEETVLSDNWYLLKKAKFDYLRRDGRWQEQIRESYDRGNGAVVLLFNVEQDTVVLIRQFRFPTFVNGNADGLLIEACAGLLDGQDPETCIRKEAEEETGFRVHAPRKVFEAYMSPGSVTELVHFFVAEYSSADRLNGGGGDVSEGEDIEVLELPLTQAMQMVRDGAIRDGKTIMLLQLAAMRGLAGLRAGG